MTFTEKASLTITLLFAVIFGYFCGRISLENQNTLSALQVQDITPEIALVSLEKISGDELEVTVNGPARILWAEEQMVENSGQHKIPLGQIPTEADLEFHQFKYAGNAKTMKFYPADSYPARGTEPQHRRFFQTKEEALSAGFEASKLVKD